MPSLITTDSLDPTYPTFPVLAQLGIILILLPAYWHFKSGNVGTILYIVWTFIGNLIYLVNAISWAGNTHSPPWLWCDLSTALMIALNVAIPTASLLITHRLFSIATVRHVNMSKADSRRKKHVEMAIGVGLPILAVLFRLPVQGHRFDIIENVGCWPSIYPTPVTFPLVYIPPILINLISSLYAVLAIRAFVMQRRQFNEVLQSTNSGLTVNRYFRLMALAAAEIVFSLPMSTFVLVANLQDGIHPWISWADTHLNFNRVETTPFGWFKFFPKVWILINLSRYSLPVGSFIFFVFLGMSGESGVFYRRQLRRVARLLGFPRPSADTPETSWTSQRGASAPLRSLPPLTPHSPMTSTTLENIDLHISLS